MGMYITSLNRTRSGVCDYHSSHYGDEDDHHDIETEDDDCIDLMKSVDFDGNKVPGDMSIEEDEDFIQSEPFNDGPDEKDFDYHYGVVTHYYRKPVSLSWLNLDLG